MIARFITERMAFLPVPKTYEDFLNITKATDTLMMKNLYDCKVRPAANKLKLNYFIPGTVKFMGGEGWFVFIGIQVSVLYDTLLLSVEGMFKDKKGIWRDFTSNSTKGIKNTKENLDILKNRLMKLSTMISNCSSSDDVFKRFRKGDIGKFLEKVDSEFDR